MNERRAQVFERQKQAFLIGALYVGLHVALDAISWVHGLANLLITPWNPPAGLALAFLLLMGWRYVPAVALGCLAADLLVRGQGFDLPSSLNFAFTFTLCYALGAAILRRQKLRLDLQGRRDILMLTLVAAIAASVAVLAHVGFLVGLGRLPAEKFLQAAFRHWVGDIIGIVTTAPLVLVLWQQREDIWPLLIDLVLPLLGVLLLSWIVFGLEITDEFKFFYLLFLPLIWMAVRHGMKGAVVGIAATQGAMMAITTWLHYEAGIVTALQALMLILALTTLLLAAIVDERRQAEANLHDHQLSLAKMTRLSLAGEMASGLAHELNQPLSAIVNYIKAAQGLLALPEPRSVEAQDALGKASSQAMRASQILGRLREFLQKGEPELEIIAVQDLIGEAQALIAPTLKRSQARMTVLLPSGLRKLRADRIHVEQVLLNLIVNAIEAMSVLAPFEREVAIEAANLQNGMVEISVSDKGPGIAPEIEGRLFEPFASSKNEGMGLGLMICRTIIEAHGGNLWHDATVKGATVFRFTLPGQME